MDDYLFFMPQLIAPLHEARDDYDIFAGLAGRLGAGDYLQPKHYEAEKVLAQLERLMASRSARNSCREWANALAERTALARASDLIERLAATPAPDSFSARLT